MKIIRGKLTPDDLSPPSLRYNSDCDCIQFTPDNGTTWVNDPSDDPRSAPKFLMPPLTGSDIPCRAAANMVEQIQNTFGAISTATSAIQIAGGLLGILLVLLVGAGILFDIVLAVAEAISSITLTVIEAAFTAEVYDEIRCILYCHLDASGRISDTGLTAAQAEIDTACGSTVGDVFALFIQMWGVNGFNNAGAMGDAPHDCSECSACTWCYEWPDEASLLADGWTHADDTAISDFWAADFIVEITKISFGFTWNGGAASGSAIAIWGAGDFTNELAFAAPLTGVGSPFEWTGDESVTGISFGLNTGTSGGGEVHVTTLHLEGIGNRPAFTHGEEC